MAAGSCLRTALRALISGRGRASPPGSGQLAASACVVVVTGEHFGSDQVVLLPLEAAHEGYDQARRPQSRRQSRELEAEFSEV